MHETVGFNVFILVYGDAKALPLKVLETIFFYSSSSNLAHWNRYRPYKSIMTFI